MNRTLSRVGLVLGLAATLALAACGPDDSPSSDAGSPASPTATTPATTEVGATGPALTPVSRSPELDAIGVIGHSGATGYNSDGQDHDVPANSWVTGTNPKVNSIYRRLLADHPALKDHNWNQAESGSSVTSLMHQAEALLASDPVPDIVFIVSVDNDIQCDGSDEDNYDPFEASMADVVAYLQGSAPGIKIFFNDQAVSVEDYDATLLTMDGGAEHLDTPGPCNVMRDGAIDPAGEAYLQQEVDAYFARLVHLCARVPDCATDEGALQKMTVTKRDVAPDMNHFTVSGLAKTAAIVWEELPAGWK